MGRTARKQDEDRTGRRLSLHHAGSEACEEEASAREGQARGEAGHGAARLWPAPRQLARQTKAYGGILRGVLGPAGRAIPGDSRQFGRAICARIGRD